MAKLSGKRRRALPASAFVYPKQRKYPLTDKSHAKAALSLSARKSTFGSPATVRAAVYRKFPSLKKTRKRGK